MSDIDDIVLLLRRGDQNAAFERLRVYLTHHSDDAIAWFWLSEATPLVPRKVEALRRFLVIAPDHPRSAAVRARLSYLEAQLATLLPEPKPTIPIRYDEDDAPALATAPRAAVVRDTPSPVRVTPPSTPIESFSPPPKSNVPLRSVTSEPPQATPPEPVRPAVRSTSFSVVSESRTVREASASHTGQPAVPTLLQSLLETAPMPLQRADTITLPDARPYPPPPAERGTRTAPPATPPPLTVPPEPVAPAPTQATAAAPDTSTTPLHTEVPAPPPITVIIQERMPVWAWVLAFLMMVQIGLQVYLIFTIQLLIAALSR